MLRYYRARKMIKPIMIRIFWARGKKRRNQVNLVDWRKASHISTFPIPTIQTCAIIISKMTFKNSNLFINSIRRWFNGCKKLRKIILIILLKKKAISTIKNQSIEVHDSIVIAGYIEINDSMTPLLRSIYLRVHLSSQI